MIETKPLRGRPKGSGLDDRARLRAVAELIAAKPELKPTTAIKSTGVTDPSAIRRLRDKYHEIGAELLAEVRLAALHPERARAATLAKDEPRIRSAAPPADSPSAASAPAEPARAPVHAPTTQAPRTATAAPLADAAAAPASRQPTPNPNDWLALWYGAGLQSLSTAVGLQLSFIDKVMRMPHVAAALRGQVAFNEMTLAFVAPRSPAAKPLH